jgi:hypothetical protein
LKFESLDHFEISSWRISTFSAGVSAGIVATIDFAAGGVLGVAKFPILFVLAAAAFYIVFTTPRRMLDRRRVSQARDSVALSAGMRASLGIVGSRSRTLSMVRPRDDSLARVTRDALRKVLLGNSIGTSLESSSQQVVSYSAATVLRSLAFLGPESLDPGDEEMRSLAFSSDLNRETKLPIFMTACFFTPIMIVLYAVFSGLRDTTSLAALAAFDFVVIDVAFYLTSGDRRNH